MEQNLLSGIKKGSAKTYRELIEKELNRLWFISFHITQKVSLAAPLLIAGWENALKSLSECDSPPEESFCAAVCGKMYKILQMTGDNDGESLNGDDYFAEVKAPALPVEYLPLVKGVDSLPKQNRIIYLLYAIGGVSASALARLLEIPLDKAKDKIHKADIEAVNTAEIRKLSLNKRAKLSAALKSTQGEVFQECEVDEKIYAAIVHVCDGFIKNAGAESLSARTRKENTNMTSKTKSKKGKRKFIT